MEKTVVPRLLGSTEWVQVGSLGTKHALFQLQKLCST